MRDGSDFRNQMCATGAASSIWPMRSRRTRDERHLDAALLADDALVLHALVLAAQALVVLDRAEDARAEQAVALRLEGAVVDGFRLLDLAVRPGQNLLRARDRDPDLVEDLRRSLRAEKIHDLLVHRRSPLADRVGRCRYFVSVMAGLDPAIVAGTALPSRSGCAGQARA